MTHAQQPRPRREPMRWRAALTGVLLLSATSAGTAGAVGGQPTRTSVPARSALVAGLQRTAGAPLEVRAGGIGGAVSFVGAAGRPLTPADDGDPGGIARSFVNRYGAAFGVDHPAQELVEDRRTTTLTGVTVRFRQQHGGVPVFGAEVAVAVSADGSITSSAGGGVPGIEVDVTPSVPGSTATRTALALAARNDHVDIASLHASTPRLELFDPALVGAPGDGVRLVWHVEVATAIGDVHRVVLVDARDGSIALQFGELHAAKRRLVCDNSDSASESCPSAQSTLVMSDVPSINVGDADAQHAFDYTGKTYDFYFSLFGRDSIDGAGMVIRSNVHYCPSPSDCPYQNAFWNGQQMVFGTGFASALDVVGHELTHGVTDYTSKLLYYAQSGAINESMSDVFGELIQLWSGQADPEWLLAEDLSVGPVRSMKDPTLYGAWSGDPRNDPDRMTSTNYRTDPSDDWGVHDNSGVGNKAAYLIAQGGAFNGHTVTGLGIVKTARIYYQAQTALLTPTSDYAALRTALIQACTSLVGGSSGIVAGDCTSVSEATAAVEMDKPPVNADVNLRRSRCGAGTVPVTYFGDGFEQGGTNWVPDGPNWTLAHIGVGSGAWSMHGNDPATSGATFVRTAGAITVPYGGTTYFAFDHTFQFDALWDSQDFYDGGVAQFSIDGGATWRDITAVGGSVTNGYNGEITGYDGDTNPAIGAAAFVNESPGVQTSLFDVTPLAGRSVMLRFGIFTDLLTPGEPGGWFIDDVAVYTCNPSSVASAAFAATGPARVLDTRPGQTGNNVHVATVQVPAGGIVPVHISGFGAGGASVPGSGTGAVSLNVAVTNPAADGFVTVYPCGNLPFAANVNYRKGQTVSNAVVAPVDALGDVCFYTSSATDLIVDLNGWFAAGTAFTSVSPVRVFDTRPGNSPNALRNVPKVPVAGDALQVDVSNLGGATPAPGAFGAVSLNVAVAAPAADGFITVYPCGTRQLVASVNYAAGQTISNAVIAPVSAGGALCFYASSPADLIVDLNGWFAAGSGFVAVGPDRVFDTRPGQPGTVLRAVPGAQIGGGSELQVQVTGMVDGSGAQVTPATGVGAVALNVAVTNPAAAGFVTVYPCGARPLTASVNYGAGQTVSNAVVAPIGPGGVICVYSLVPTDVVVDITGWFPG